MAPPSCSHADERSFAWQDCRVFDECLNLLLMLFSFCVALYFQQ